ncbi:efflux RND transporter periplasmic adaptor subunit [Streptococcus constellatus]|uniref:Efflux transporter, RND family, MFP subunit n=1 Tax=Streptococcus constellatus subsp. constellatus SK53 TaxID=1095730 RepID=A0AAD2Y3J9_STRCV|nr:efflux RND transporter periplasmic adaptor subunit [Streptococcus constellatus]EID18915.1 efflux transporter, RND family, MFP subunit [Streptococcus constellatus subsp. constellatus SK53]MDP1485098.1 efflux RND transporter periplasmic adaptor subunit [Streptococcus constellatus]QQT05751.1 efflux RND transporter periplasmic adaptor subunit [Streptococcus constellatus]SUN40303.1 efflux transporter [Streptococcus constellatus]BBD22371.1 transporter [Streptococcus constellatus subsp. constellat
MKKLKKWQLFSLIGVTTVVILGAIGTILLFNGNNVADKEKTIQVQKVREGSVASSVLLSGNIAATNEQYVYYDSTKGDLDSVLVNVGDKVTAGQALVQYKSVEAQAAYDTAVRALNKIDRQIYDLKTYGTTIETTGDAATDDKTTASAQRSVDSQLKDLQDNRADAEANVNKAQAQLNATTVTSANDGTVVEVNRDVSKSTTGANQTLVHIVNNGNLQVKGELSEYNLANLSVGQEVTMTSKVYPDKKWTGKISYISNYPKDNQNTAAAGAGNASSGAKYPYTVDITSEIGDLKQGFSINIEVKNKTRGILVPVSSIVSESNKSYIWTIEKGTAKKVQVTLGNADAKHQEISSGLTKDSKVITNPTDSLKDGQEVKSYEETH